MALISTNNNKYFKSKHVRIFPSSFRGNYTKLNDTNATTFDPEARLNTEANFIAPKNDMGKNTYIVEYIKTETESVIKFVLGGYYFEIFEIDSYKAELKDKFIGITLRDINLKASDTFDSSRSSHLLASWDGNSDFVLDREFDENTYYFTGLKVINAGDNGIASQIKLFDTDGNINQEYLLPEFKHGSGNNSVTHGNGLLANYAYQTVVGKYNNNKSTSIFEIGTGTSDSNRSNAVDVSATETTISTEVNISKDTDSTSTTTGAMKIAGGLGVAKNIYTNGLTTNSATINGATSISGTTSIQNDTNIANKISIKKSPSESEKDVTISGKISITGETSIATNATIDSTKTTLVKPLEITDTTANALKVSGDSTINGNLTVGGTSNTLVIKKTPGTGEYNANITGTLNTSGKATLASADIGGATNITGATSITGTTNITGAVNINQTAAEPSPINIKGATNIIGVVNINQGDAVTAQNVNIKGDVAVTGKLTSTYTTYADTDSTVLTTKSYVDNKVTTYADSKVNALNVESSVDDDEYNGKYIKTIKQENGQVSATSAVFETTFNAETNDNAPTSKAISEYVSDEFENVWYTAKTKTSAESEVKNLKEIILNATYPIGSIYMMYSADNVTTCPIENTLGGTWAAIDSGNFLVAADDNVNSLYYHSKTGGSANTELISHTHTYTTHTEQTISGGEHKHMVAYKASKTGTGSWTGFEGNTGDKHSGYVIETTLDKDNYPSIASYDKTIAPGTQYYGDHTHTFTLPNIANNGTWDDGNGKNLPPYLAVYMWRRTN